MAKKLKVKPYAVALSFFRDHGFDIVEAPGTSNRIFLKKYNVSAAVEQAPDGSAKIFAFPGYLVGGEISKLIDKGYQKFLKTSKLEVPATADHLDAMHKFSEELKEGIGATSLYNESMGTVSEAYVYDRVKDRDKPDAERPQRPWESNSKKPA